MPTRHYFYGRGPVFIADPHSIDRNQGRQIDWASVPASYADPNTGKKILPAGKIMVEISTGPTAGMLTTRAERPNAETASCILETQANEGELSASLSGYGCIVGGVLFGNLLPDSANAAFGTFQTELQASGPGYRFETYADTRGT